MSIVLHRHRLLDLLVHTENILLKFNSTLLPQSHFLSFFRILEYKLILNIGRQFVIIVLLSHLELRKAFFASAFELDTAIYLLAQ